MRVRETLRESVASGIVWDERGTRKNAHHLQLADLLVRKDGNHLQLLQLLVLQIGILLELGQVWPEQIAHLRAEDGVAEGATMFSAPASERASKRGR